LCLTAGGCQGRCGGPAQAPGALSQTERQALPGTIVFLSERDGQKDIWRVTPTGQETRVTSAPEDEYPGPPSPDGRSLLVIASGEAGGRIFQQLRLQPLAGGPAVALHPPRSRARNASWAPDGTWLAAESDARGFSDIVRVLPQANAEDTPLTQVKQGCFEPAVSPDGREVACVCTGDGDPEVYVYRADGQGAPRRLTTFYLEDRSPLWSPDGKWLAFVSNRERKERVYLIRPDGSDLRALSGDTGFAGDEREPAFSPDGQQVVYVARSPDGRSRLWRAAVAGGAPVPLTDGTRRDDMPAWSPDGQALVFVSERDGDTDLYLMRPDGTGQTRLTTAKGADWLPRWFLPR
jgi:TolB protein